MTTKKSTTKKSTTQKFASPEVLAAYNAKEGIITPTPGSFHEACVNEAAPMTEEQKALEAAARAADLEPQKFVDVASREVLMLTREEAKLRDVVPHEWSTEGMDEAAALKATVVSKVLRARDVVAARVAAKADRKKLSRFNQPVACRMCGKLTTWSEVNGNCGLDLCAACFNDANMENEHLDGHHNEIPGLDCKYCMAAAQKVAAQTTEELAVLVAEVEQAAKLAKGKKGKKVAKTALVLVEQAKEALAPVETVEPELGASKGITLVSGVTGEVLAEIPAPVVEPTVVMTIPGLGTVELVDPPAAPAPVVKVAKAKKAPKAKAVKPVAAEATGALKVRLYAHGILYFGKAAAAALVNGQSHLLITLDGLTLTVTPGTTGQEVKYSHGQPQLSISKLLAASGWSKLTQDLAVTVLDGSFQVTVA